VTDFERDYERFIRAEISRRRLLRRGAAGALGVSALSYLAACGSETGGGDGGEAKEDAKTIAKGEIAKSMYFANWPLYIEEDRGTLKEFEKKYGTKVKYVEEINDNVEFFGKVRQQYERGDSGGRDIHVVSDWMADRMIQLGYVQRFDKKELPKVEANLIQRLKSPPFDPKREFSVPWQSGQTGIIYLEDKVKREPKSVEDLFDPAYKGKVTMLTEMRDSVGMVAAFLGHDPEKATLDQFMEAVDLIDKNVQSGQIRGFTGNEYIKDLPKADSWLVLGWSGDAIALSSEQKNIKFVTPESGFHLWTDNMQIPVGAPAAYTAQKFIDFVYDPKVAVDITAYVNYVCPVEGVQEILAERDPKLAESQFIFPDNQTLSNAFVFRGLKPEEARELDDAFQRVIGA
jgi:spermidine/putrescine transport system substrate-binding protein